VSVGGNGCLLMEQCTVQNNKATNKVSYNSYSQLLVLLIPLLLHAVAMLCVAHFTAASASETTGHKYAYYCSECSVNSLCSSIVFATDVHLVYGTMDINALCYAASNLVITGRCYIS
jgi:hypothetical protein